MARELRRSVSKSVERELWGRAAGRCEVAGCNAFLFRSPLTQEPVNLAQVAHIYSFSPKGPRGWGRFDLFPSKLNTVENLMLVCHACHKTIDQDVSGVRYGADLLESWKKAHETRIAVVTGISADKKSNVLLYGANIAAQQSIVSAGEAFEALFPEWYPASERPTVLSMRWASRDDNADYWRIEAANLLELFRTNVLPLLEAGEHVSVFGLAPMPLLIRLGSLMTDKSRAEVYQLHREPRTWRWLADSKPLSLTLSRPRDHSGQPVLVLAVSDVIDAARVEESVGSGASIWTLSSSPAHNDVLRSRAQLAEFRRAVREALDEIGRVHGKSTTISIVPAVPVACAIELGRLRMPKADADWKLFDYRNDQNRYLHVLTINAGD